MVANPPARRVELSEAPLGRWSHDDFMRLAPEDQKAELINGMLIVMPPPSDIHERLQGFLYFVVMGFVKFFKLGEVRGSRSAVRIAPHQTYEPDVLFVSQARLSILAEHQILEAPDLVIEILSSSTAEYDRGVKRENYARAGVRELWLVDPYGPSGTQFFQQREGQLVEVMPMDGVIHSVALPGFKLKINWLWSDERGQLADPMAVLSELGVRI
jgi:Uma2 family endonuclease